MSADKKVNQTRKIVFAGAGLAVSLYLGLLFLQLFIFPNFFFTSDLGVDVRITPYSTREGLYKADEKFLDSIPASPIPGVFAVGIKVEISGTGGDGLRMREDPGMDSEILYLAREGEDCIILEGPKIEENLIWWKIQSLEEENKSGWSVQTYMNTINNN